MRDLLRVEDSDELLDPCCAHTLIPHWALIRTAVLRQVLSTLIYNSAPIGQSSASTSRCAIASTLAKSVVYNGKRTSLRGDICFMTSSLGLIPRGDVQFDRLSGYFADCAPDRSFAWEDQYQWRWLPRRAFDRVVFQAPLQAAGAILGRVKVNKSQQRAALAIVDAASRRVSEHLGITLDVNVRVGLASSLARRIASGPFLFDAYMRELKRRQVRLLFKEDGCYGSSAIVLAAANSMGVRTAEFQHGALSVAHDAYNVAPAVAASPAFRDTLPRHFLGYGQWWNSQMNVPVNKIVVGNPHRDETLAARKTAVNKGHALLVLGDGIETDRYLTFMRQVSSEARAQGLRPIFRPHPFERARFAGERPENEFEIDTSSDIYDAFAGAAVVVSEISTGLFEAMGLVEHILIWNTPKAAFTFPEHPFQPFEDAEEFVALLSSGSLRRISQQEVHGIWAPSWRSNYLAFISSALSGATPTQQQPA